MRRLPYVTLAFPILLALVSCATTSRQNALRAQADALERAEAKGDTAWLADGMTDPGTLAKMKEESCAPHKGRSLSKKSCLAKVQKLFERQVKRRYPYANASLLDRKCKASRKDCKDYRTYEAWARDSHNTYLEQLRAAKEAELANPAPSTASSGSGSSSSSAIYDSRAQGYLVEFHPGN